ncbi:MAG TPA: ADOP family duplicated permease [Thermoanaerobaculia bacterium]|nr:ADOP family duplicated permease [Thermoanaerobaculia bacterium]
MKGLGLVAEPLRSASRALLRRRSLTLTTVLLLGLGLAATAVVGSLVDRVLLRPLPYPDAERLVMVWMSSRTAGESRLPLNPVYFWQLHDRVRSFASVEAFVAGPDVGFDLVGRGAPARVSGAAVTPGFFALLGARPMLGRSFLPGEGAGDRVAVLGHDLWRDRFGADRTILGRSLDLSGRSWTVVGVMPSGFDFPGVELWVPGPLEAGQAMNLPLPVSYGLRVLARLEPTASLPQAREEVAALGRHLLGPAGEAEVSLRTVPLREDLIGEARPALLILLVAVGLLLVVTCVNTANLLLAHLVRRERELAVRGALGASPAMIAGQLLSEGLLLGLAGSATALLLAFVGLRALPAVASVGSQPLGVAQLDGPLMLLVVGLGILSGTFLAVLPALRGARLDLPAALQGTGSKSRTTGPLAALVIGEIALALVLVIGAGLLVRSVRILMGEDLGFDDRNVVTGKLVLTGQTYATVARQTAFLQSLAERIGNLPGVRQAAFSSSLPFEPGGLTLAVAAEGTEAMQGELPSVDCVSISPDYFRALGVPLSRGRGILPSDGAASPRVAVLDDAIAKSLFGTRNPIGRRIQLFGQWRQVVGVVPQVQQQGFRRVHRAMAYLPSAQFPLPWPFYHLVIRTEGEPLEVLLAVRSAIAEVDRDQPLSSVGPLSELVARATARERSVATVLALVAACALVLAAFGVYAVMAFSLEQRSREIGIRAALGARSDHLVALILAYGGRIALGGVLVGVLAALAATRFLRSLLYGVAPTDPASFIAAALLAGTVALLAALTPLRRAMRLDLAQVLRAE